MKILNNLFKKGFALMLALVLMFSVVACGGKKDDSTSTSESASESISKEESSTESTSTQGNVSLKINAPTKEMSLTGTLPLTVDVTNAKDKSYTWSFTNNDDKYGEPILKVENNVLSVVGSINVDKIINVRATSKEDPTVYDEIAVTVRALQTGDGKVGDLTQAMITEIANDSITLKGVVTDYYTDFKNTFNSSENRYYSEVQMESGKWYGRWNVLAEDDPELAKNVVENTYVKGAKDNVRDQYGNIGHEFQELLIDKNNQVQAKTIKDYLSIPAVWEAQHLWNHLGNIKVDADHIGYNAEDERYEFKYSLKDEDALYFLTYISYSFTPMLEDTLDVLQFEVEDGHISKIYAQTEVLYYGADTREDADAMSYTTVVLDIENIGKTTVKEPTPFSAPEHVDKLQSALDNMKAHLTNYTFATAETTTYAPSYDDEDYSYAESERKSTVKYAPKGEDTYADGTCGVFNNSSSKGTVGVKGWINDDVVLFANTGKYSYTMDGKAYHTEYSGYKKVGDGLFDAFTFSTKAYNAPNGNDNHYTSAFMGTRQYQGEIADMLPKFDFSANVFKFEGVNNGKYTFVLEATSATRDIAMEVSCYTNAKSGSAGTNSKTYITVDGNGNLISTVYPYNISGIYMGYCTTTYSNIGTTDFATAFKHTKEEIFANYIPRPIKENWADYTMKYYSSTHSTKDSHEESASVALEAIFGADAKDLPTPKALISVFGDCLYGPFYDWKNIYEKDGETVKGYIDYFSVNTESPVYDENSQLSDEEFTKLIAKLDSALASEGFTKDMANTDVSGGATGRSDRYVCYTKNNVQLVIDNNHTKNIFMSFYKLGDWTLRK